MIIRHFLMKNATLCKWPLLKYYCNFAVPQKQACPQYRKTKTNKEKQLWSVEKLKIFEFRARLSILFNFSSFRLANMKKYRSSCKTLGISLGRKRDKVSYLHRDVVPKSQKYFVIISKMAAAAVVWEKRKSKRTFIRKKVIFRVFVDFVVCSVLEKDGGLLYCKLRHCVKDSKTFLLPCVCTDFFKERFMILKKSSTLAFQGPGNLKFT